MTVAESVKSAVGLADTQGMFLLNWLSSRTAGVLILELRTGY
jgi:hypothetical protein